MPANRFKITHLSKIILFRSLFSILLIFLSVKVSDVLAIEISDTPLDAHLNAPAPNVMLVWDDSGSMDSEFMTSEPEGLFDACYHLYIEPDDAPSLGRNNEDGPALNAVQRRMWMSQWEGYNRLYYNPHRSYAPWPSTRRFAFDMADLNTPRFDPTRTTGSNPRLRMAETFFSVNCGPDVVVVPNAHYFTFNDANENKVLDSGEPLYLVVWQDFDGDRQLDVTNRLANDQRRYYRYDDDGDGLVENNELIPVASEVEKNAVRPVVYDSRGKIERFKTDQEDLQNFVNWFTYFRKREYVAKFVAARELVDARRQNVGIYAVNDGPRIGVHARQAQSSDERRDTADGAIHIPDESEKLLNQLYATESKGKTPLRRALDQVGRYFDQKSSSELGGSPFQETGQGGRCQRSNAVVLTDGFWNGDFSGIGNSDGDQGAPFADVWRDTLADVAMYYYKNDLSPALADQVPGRSCDDAPHQHMVTYALSFGIKGSIDTADINGDGRKDLSGYEGDPCFGSPDTPRPDWPQPVADQFTTIDDLWHAVINGRGRYFNAGDPGSLTAAMNNIFGEIGASSAASGIVVNGLQLKDHSVVYQARYTADDWSGDVLAFSYNPQTGEVENSPELALWSAASQLQLSNNVHDRRRIVTYGGPWLQPEGVPFRYGNLSDNQKIMLGSDLAIGSSADTSARNALDFIRGKEFAHLRKRSNLLGDIVHSAPVLHDGTLFVGSNDGMLHAFDAQSGGERFAYVPHLVFQHLKALSKPDYADRHLFYVDATPYVGEVLEAIYERKTYLLGGLGKGGKGYYCLLLGSRKREQAGSRFGSYHSTISIDEIKEGAGEYDLCRIVMWEYPRPDMGNDGMDNDADGLIDEPSENDPDIGYSFGQGYVVNANTSSDSYLPVAIFGNGYNSRSGKAMLYIVDVRTGILIRKLDTGVGEDNGLSTPALIDVNVDRCVDYVYAGDLKGNLWKFDLRAEDPRYWGSAYGEDFNGDGVIDAEAGDLPRPLFQDVHQPITGRPDVMAMASACAPEAPGYMVIFGTGKYLGLSDRYDTTQQSIYGIWDYGDDSDDSEYPGFLIERSGGRLSSGLSLAHLQATRQYDGEGMVYRELSEWKRENYSTTEDEEDGDGVLANNEKETQEVNPEAFAGWFFDFPTPPAINSDPGERVTGNVSIRGGKAVVVSFAPVQEPCKYGGISWLYILNGCGDNVASPEMRATTPMAKRYGRRIADHIAILKAATDSRRDVILCSDQTGQILRETFLGEEWGKVFWRQNDFE